MLTIPLVVRILLVISLFLPQLTYAEKILIAANNRIATSYARWTAEQSCHEISNFSNANANRGTVDLILICQALVAGGFNAEIVIFRVPNYLRALALAAAGKVHMPAESVWRREIRESVLYHSPAIIREGEFEKGIYTSPANTKALAVSSLEELLELTAAIPKVWEFDKALLKEMGARVIYVSQKESLFKLVASKRADFTLLEFSSTPSLGKTYAGVRLVPVNNIKVTIKGTRHFVVSKEAEGALRLHKALVKGVTQLRRQGRIRRAYQESGFISDAVKDWKSLY